MFSINANLATSDALDRLDGASGKLHSAFRAHLLRHARQQRQGRRRQDSVSARTSTPPGKSLPPGHARREQRRLLHRGRRRAPPKRSAPSSSGCGDRRPVQLRDPRDQRARLHPDRVHRTRRRQINRIAAVTEFNSVLTATAPLRHRGRPGISKDSTTNDRIASRFLADLSLHHARRRHRRHRPRHGRTDLPAPPSPSRRRPRHHQLRPRRRLGAAQNRIESRHAGTSRPHRTWPPPSRIQDADSRRARPDGQLRTYSRPVSPVLAQANQINQSALRLIG